MGHRTVLAVIAALSFGGATAVPAAAKVPVQTITVINKAHVPATTLAAVERAVVAQSRQLRDWWQTPLVAFGPGGWKLTLMAHLDATDRVYKFDGYHLVDFFANPDGSQGSVPLMQVVAIQNGPDPWSMTFSHEVMEALVDPNDTGDEVCDPVLDVGYHLRGVMVSDFVLRSWFYNHSRGPWDQMHMLPESLTAI